MTVVSKPVPVPTIRRLPKYLAYVRQLKENGQEWVVSRELAEAIRCTDSTVRQDFRHLDCLVGESLGYDIEYLEMAIVKVLGLDVPVHAVIVGAGDLGQALARSLDGRNSAARTFRICGIFDPDPRLHGKKLGNLVVEGTDALPRVVFRESVAIGMVAVAPWAAQRMVTQLVSAGVRGLLNFTSSHVALPATVPVVDAHMLASLQELSGMIRMRPDHCGRHGKSARRA